MQCVHQCQEQRDNKKLQQKSLTSGHRSPPIKIIKREKGRDLLATLILDTREDSETVWSETRKVISFKNFKKYLSGHCLKSSEYNVP